jgi:hypothetical protein
MTSKSEEFNKFDAVVGKVFSVPHKEIIRRERVYQRKRNSARERREAMRKQDAALADKIVTLYRRGVLASPFDAANVRDRFSAQYEETHYTTVLANYCEGGYFQKKFGTPPRFRRVSRGKYACV